MPVPQKLGMQVTRLLGSLGLAAVVSEAEAGFVAVAGVFVKHALGDGLVDGGHRGVEEIARSGRVAGGDSGTQTAHQRADPGAVGAVHFGALTRLRRPLQNRLFLLLNFGSLSLGHLLLLLCTAQTSNVKRGHGLCQTRRKVLPGRKCRRSRSNRRSQQVRAPPHPGVRASRISMTSSACSLIRGTRLSPWKRRKRSGSK